MNDINKTLYIPLYGKAYVSKKGIILHFQGIIEHLLMDCYTTFAAKASKYKNPINDVGVTEVYGLDDSKVLESSGISFVKEHEMTSQNMINELKGIEKSIFKKLYAGSIAKKMYRLYEYKYERKV